MTSANIPHELESLRQPLDTVSPDPTNPKLHDAAQVAAIAASFVEFGQDQPIVASTDGIIALGEGRYLAAKSLGWVDAAILFRPWSEITRLRRNLADNRTHDMSGYDDEILFALATQLSSAENGGRVPGFDDDFLNTLAELVADVESSDDADGDDESDFDDDFDGEAIDAFDNFVVFRFGDFRGNVGRDVYDSFVEKHRNLQDETGEPMLDDVLRIWLNV